MKKLPIFVKILIGLFVVVAILVIVAAFQPSHYEVKRSTKIAAPPAAVFPQVNTLKNWEAWNPWMKLDPNIKLTYTGPASGKGASYSWTGNNEVGEGSATILESRPDEFVRFRLDFRKPMEATSHAEFTLQPQGDQTEITWKMSGENNLIGKAISMFMSMDKMIGEPFEKGLADMKSIAESSTKK
jgi:hypothetical protein